MQLKTLNRRLAQEVPGIQLHFGDEHAKNMHFRYADRTVETDVPWLNRLTADQWVDRAKSVKRGFGTRPVEAIKEVAQARQDILAGQAPDGLNRFQLRQLAKSKGLKGYGRMTVAQLREALAA